MELLIIEEQGLIEKINIPQRCNECHVEEQTRYKSTTHPLFKCTHTQTHTPGSFISTDWYYDFHGISMFPVLLNSRKKLRNKVTTFYEETTEFKIHRVLFICLDPSIVFSILQQSSSLTLSNNTFVSCTCGIQLIHAINKEGHGHKL